MRLYSKMATLITLTHKYIGLEMKYILILALALIMPTLSNADILYDITYDDSTPKKSA